MLQDRLPVKFKDPKFKHEIFMRIDMKHSYFSIISLFICNQFSVVEIIMNCLLIAKNYCYMKVTNLTLYVLHRNILIYDILACHLFTRHALYLL